MDRLPDVIGDTEVLEELLSRPTPGVIETLARVEGDLLFLGVGGKMGPTLARMAVRASREAGVRRRVLGVSRFSTPGLAERLESQGITCISCDLLNPAEVSGLPEVANVVVMTGLKFGTGTQAAHTWATNVWLPGAVCQRYRQARILAFSTGNVYGLCPVRLAGSVESDPCRPVGEYAMSALGRERMYEHFSAAFGTPMALLRLNYATEMRYGVLADIGRKVHAGQPVDLSMGHLNSLWQGDANAWSLQALAHLASPPFVLNLAGPELLSVRRVAEQFAQLFGKSVEFVGAEADNAFLSNSQRCVELFGYPRVGPGRMIAWLAEWIRRGGEDLGKPTHYESRQGDY